MKLKDKEVLILIILLIASTFIGIPINGGDKGWMFLNQVFRDFVMRNKGFEYSLINIYALVSTFILYAMPFFRNSIYDKQIYIALPLLYLIITFLYFPLLFTLFIPFIIIWIILLWTVYERPSTS